MQILSFQETSEHTTPRSSSSPLIEVELGNLPGGRVHLFSTPATSDDVTETTSNEAEITTTTIGQFFHFLEAKLLFHNQYIYFCMFSDGMFVQLPTYFLFIDFFLIGTKNLFFIDKGWFYAYFRLSQVIVGLYRSLQGQVPGLP